jgi:hypothetical protein
MEYTYFNWFLFVATFFVGSSKFTEFVRASSLIVFMGWALVIAFYGYGAVVRFYRGHYNNPNMSLEHILIIDFIAHVLPVLVLGIPNDRRLFLAASIIVVIWYLYVREYIHKIYYLPVEHLQYRDAILFGGAVVINGTLWTLKAYR